MYLQALCSVSAGLVECVCRPCAVYLQALCCVFAGPVQCICRPCALYLQAGCNRARLVVLAVRALCRHFAAGSVQALCCPSFLKLFLWTGCNRARLVVLGPESGQSMLVVIGTGWLY